MSNVLKQRLPEPYEGPRRQALVAFLLTCGMADKMRIRFANVPSPMDNSQPVPSILLKSTSLLTTLVSAYQPEEGDFDLQEDVDKKLIKTFRDTHLFGVVALLISVLSSEGKPRAAGRVPGPVATLALAIIKILNHIGRINLEVLQKCLGDAPTELYHMMIFVFDYCTQRLQDRSADPAEQDKNRDLLHNALWLVGRYVINNEANQRSLVSGLDMTLLARLTALPIQYFVQEKFKKILFPTLIAAVHNNKQNLALIRVHFLLQVSVLSFYMLNIFYFQIWSSMI